MSAIPTVIIGRNPKIASKVREGLLPEYDGVKDLPLLLSTPSKTPEDTDENLGSRNYGARPVAIGVGGGFNDEMVDEMRVSCKEVDEGDVWLRADVTKIADMPSLNNPDAYGADTAVRLKKKMQSLSIGTGADQNNTISGVYFFT